jgi:anti-anti-sigma factor
VSDLLGKETSMHPPRRERLRIVRAPSRGSEHLLRLEGELDLGTAALLRESLDDLADGCVVLDLDGVSFTDSTGLATLIAERGRARHHGASLRVRTGTLPLLAGGGQRRRAT